jgi:D-alanyl-D-alanine carboxypeptidase (penicillin-binding protein 5/6)
MKFFKNKYRFLYLTILTFVFISTSALAISGQIPPVKQIINPPHLVSKNFPPNPVLAASSSLPAGRQDFPILSAQGALAVDLDSGVSLYEKNPDTKLLPASTTKIVTGLVALDSYPLDQIITIGRKNVVGQKMGLYPGEQISVENLLYGLLVYSANDAAEALAMNYPGGYDAFIVAMNAKAKNLSMINSNFQNPVGLDGLNQVTTAQDLIRVSEVAVRIPEFAKIVGTKSIGFTDVSGKIKYNLKNINELLGVVPGVLGIKTGWTENARENLVTYIERDGHKVMIAVLGSQDRFGETKELIDWIFANYNWQEVKLP